MINLYRKYKELIDYLFFGVLTTVVGFGTYALVIALLKPSMHTQSGQANSLLILLAQIIQWIAAVLFAFVVNKLFVFHDRAKDLRTVLRQLLVFSSSRLVTLILETLIIYGCMWVLSAVSYRDFWLFNQENIAKLIAAVFVIISNYFISKFLVFSRKGKSEK